MSQSDYKVLAVSEVTLTLLKSNPPQLSIMAIGMVATTGFEDHGKLIEYLHKQPPADGIYDFDFVATRTVLPGGHVGNIVHPIYSLPHIISHIPAGFKGVRVHAAVGSRVALLDENTKHVRFEFDAAGSPILD